MLDFKKLKQALLTDFIITSDGDLDEAAAFSHGTDVIHGYVLKHVRELESTVEYLRSENKKLKKKYKTYKEKI